MTKSQRNMYLRRLRKLADHITTKSARGHDRFDFGVISERQYCGTAACAMGELPFCFPRHFFVTKWPAGDKYASRFPHLRNGFSNATFSSARVFFNLSERAAGHLFLPGFQLTKRFGGRELSVKATPKQVARNILVFCERVERGEVDLGMYPVTGL